MSRAQDIINKSKMRPIEILGEESLKDRNAIFTNNEVSDIFGLSKESFFKYIDTLVRNNPELSDKFLYHCGNYSFNRSGIMVIILTLVYNLTGTEASYVSDDWITKYEYEMNHNFIEYCDKSFINFMNDNCSTSDCVDNGGYVYLISDSLGHYKIGVSTNPGLRLQELQVGNSQRLSLVGCILSDTPYKLESKIHKHYVEFRVFGEWYTLSKKQVQELIKKYSD